jgi:hypothetical protein
MIYFFYSIKVFNKDNLAVPILLKSGIYPVTFSFVDNCHVDDVFDEIKLQVVEWLETTRNVDADDYIIHFNQFNQAFYESVAQH